MMEQVLDVPTQEVITKDNATISADGVTFFQILDAARAAYEVRDLERAVLNLTMTNIRTVMGSMDLDELLSKRDEINLVDAMGRQMKAERDKRANILEAEGFRQAEILKAEGEKQSQILQAEGEKEAAFREAEARERLAQAEAEATRMVSEAISNGDSQAINYFVAQKYTEALTNIASAPNQKVIMMPLEASSLIGSLGGIGSIAKDVFGDFIQALGPWTWVAVGLLILGIEIMMPSTLLLWPGLSALAVGFITLVLGTDAAIWPWQASDCYFS